MQRFTQMSGYQIMWIWALFDLPAVSKSQRKHASRFRKDLLDHGFEMVQFSVYAKYCASRERAEQVAEKIGKLVPQDGKIDMLFFTDKQYEMIRSYRGTNQAAKPKKPEQMSFF